LRRAGRPKKAEFNTAFKRLLEAPDEYRHRHEAGRRIEAMSATRRKTRPKEEAAPTLAARALEALAGMPCVAPTVAELATAAGIAEAKLGRVLWGQERIGAVELWTEAGKVRAMLSARTAGRMGLKLDRLGKRWEGLTPPARHHRDLIR